MLEITSELRRNAVESGGFASAEVGLCAKAKASFRLNDLSSLALSFTASFLVSVIDPLSVSPI